MNTPLQHLSAALAALVAGAAPSIVSVRSRGAQSSGFAWKPGLVVTADEALAEEGEVAVTLAGGARHAATILGRDATTDIALLRIEGAPRPVAAWATTAPPTGALAVAVGAQDGAPSAALGAIGHAGPAWRSLRGGEIDVRIDLAVSIRRHAEGGLALDAAGQALGMLVFGPRRRVLVIPAATIHRVAAALEAHGRIARGYLGLGMQSVRVGEGMGVMVMGVDRDGPGAAAGIHQGDVITAWEDTPVRGVRDLVRGLGPESIGRTVTLTLNRAGAATRLAVTIGERAKA